MRPEITDVVVTPAGPAAGPLRAYVTLLADGWLRINGVKIVVGKSGKATVWFPEAFPSRRCPDPDCRARVEYRHRYCWSCGGELSDAPSPLGANGLLVRHSLVFPITTAARRAVEEAVFAVWEGTEGFAR